MPYQSMTNRLKHRKPKSRSRQSLQKPNGIIGPRPSSQTHLAWARRTHRLTARRP